MRSLFARASKSFRPFRPRMTSSTITLQIEDRIKCQTFQNNERQFCKVTDSHCAESYLRDIYEAGVADEDPFSSTDSRSFFSSAASNQNPLVDKAISADSIEAVLNLVHEPGFDAEVAVQCVASLNYLQLRLASQQTHEVDYLEAFAEFNHTLRSNEQFQIILDTIKVSASNDLPLDVLAVLYKWLRRLEEPLSSLVMQQIVIVLKRNVHQMDVTTLANFFAGLCGRTNKYSMLQEQTLMIALTLYPALTRLRQCIDEATTPDEIRKIAFCFCGIPRLVSNPLLDKFLAKVLDMIEDGSLNTFDKTDKTDKVAILSSLVRVSSLALAKRDYFINKCSGLIQILGQFKGHVDLLTPIQALITSKVILESCEPASVYYELMERVLKDMTKRKKSSNADDDNLAARVPEIDQIYLLVRSGNRSISSNVIEDVILETLYGSTFALYLGQLYEILRLSDVGTPQLMSEYLTRALKVCESNMSDLYRLSTRYTHNMSLIGGEKTDSNFEKSVVAIYMKDMLETPFAGRFAGQFAFVINFGRKDLSEESVVRFHSMVDRMTPFSLFLIGSAIDRWQRKSTKAYNSGKLHEDINSVKVAIIKRTFNLMETENLYSNTLLLFRTAVVFIKDLDQRQISEMLQSKWGQDLLSPDMMSLSTIRVMAMTLSYVRPYWEMPSVVETLVDHVLKHENDLHAISLFHIVYINFLLRPQICEEKTRKFHSLTASCLLRDLDSILGLNAIRMALALARYKQLTPEIAVKIFSMEFMDILDREIAKSGASSDYGRRSRFHMMLLNRTVRLNHPEFNIPWFHEKFCAQNLPKLAFHHTERPMQSKLREDVYDSLLEAVGGDPRYVREQVYTPFWHNIDFELAMEKSSKTFLPVTDSSDSLTTVRKSSNPSKDVERFAVIVHGHSHFTSDTQRLIGMYELHNHNLKMEGYTVIAVSPMTWNKMAMTIGQAKKDFVKNLLLCGNNSSEVVNSADDMCGINV